MTWDNDLEVLLRWVCLNKPGGPIACVDGNGGTPPPPLTGMPAPFEVVTLQYFAALLAKPDRKWRGLHLNTNSATLESLASLPERMRPLVDGPVSIRVNEAQPGLRETWDNRFIRAGWIRHPLSLTAVAFNALESEGPSVLLTYLPLNESINQAHPLEALAAERNLHMDMLRETGRRSDAHLARYTWALEFIRPNDHVIDAACGLGYGSAIVRSGSPCGRVVGLDISATAIAYAQEIYGAASQTLEYRVCDLADLSSIADNSVDCFISFETFEHLVDPRAFAGEIQRVLKPGGRLLCSVPNRWVDETGKDPSPYHLHTFDLPLLLSVCERFRIESVVAQCAGGSDPRFDPIRKLETFEQPPVTEEMRGVEWWLLAAMKDPLTPGEAVYQETVFPALQRKPASAPYANGHLNPWIVHSLVHLPFRLKSRPALVRAASQLATSANPGSADHGAALAVRAYQALGKAPAFDPAELDAIAGAIRHHLTVNPQAAHEHRWQISLSFVLAQISLSLGRRAQARHEFEQCAGLDFRRFAPHIATKTTEAAFQAGRLALYDGDFESAKRCFHRGLEIGRQLGSVALDDVLIDPSHPHLHGLGDGMREYVLALDSVGRCANGLAVIDHYKRLGKADILTLDRSWQWEVQHLSNELRNSQAHSEARLKQVEVLTRNLRKFEIDADALHGQVAKLTLLAKEYEREANQRAAQVDTLTANLKTTEPHAQALLQQVRELTDLVKLHENESRQRAAQIEALTPLVKQHEAESSERERQIVTLTKLVKHHESESNNRAGQIETLTTLAQNQQRQIQQLAEQIRLNTEELAAARQSQARELTLRKEMQDAGTETSRLLRRAQGEASLAARMLELSASLPVPAPAVWTQIPFLPRDETPDATVRCHLETVDFSSNPVRIMGWGFSENTDAAPANPPCLLLTGASNSWVLRGTRIERPDVAAAFPVEGPAVAARLHSGFVFEFHPSQLPVPAPCAFRIQCGLTAGTPVLTPEFSLS